MSGARLLHLLYEIRASYWAVPGVLVFAAVGLALLLGFIDVMVLGSLTEATDAWWTPIVVSPSIARDTLTTTAAAMMSVAGVTFSMTIVAVSFAGGQFGPRLIGNFMRDRGNQVSLGAFIATFAYCMVALRMIRDDPEQQAFVPQLTVQGSLLLTVVCLVVFIYFIHHVPETINVGNITASLGRRLRAGVPDAFPRAVGQPCPDEALAPSVRKRLEIGRIIESPVSGYVVTIESARLLAVARSMDAVVELRCRPGDFLVAGDALAVVPADVELSEQHRNGIRSSFALGRERTSEQNLLFLVDELVEILGRALSPGINDPFTAIGCINWLRVGLAEIVRHEDAAPLRGDDAGVPRVLTQPVTVSEFLACGLGQSLQYVASDRNAVSAMLKMVGQLARAAPPGPTRVEVMSYGERLLAASLERLPVEADRVLVREGWSAIEDAVAQTRPTSPRELADVGGPSIRPRAPSP